MSHLRTPLTDYSFLVSFLVDARGGAMRGCRHSGVRIIVPARSAAQPTRITCRYVKPQRTMHPPPLMEGEALASRVLELGPVGAKFLGPVIMEVPHFASLRGKEREIVILRSDNGETWREHTIDNSDEIISEVLNDCLEPEGESKRPLLKIQFMSISNTFRHRSNGRVGRRSHLPLRHLRLPTVLCRNFAHPPGGPRDWTGGRYGLEHCRSAGSGRVPAGRTHEED
jgi:hypothetical protein